MDNVLIVSLLFWPNVVVVCAALNMLITWTVSWAELIFDVMIGVIAGYFLYAGVQPDPHPAVTFFFIFSHGVPAAVWWLTDGLATLGTGMDPAAFIGWMALLRVGAVLWTAGFDRISTLLGARLGWGAFFFSFVVAPAKLMFATFTSAVGFLIWLAGFFWAFGGGRASFAGGVLLTEFKPGSATNYHATTLGWTVHTWHGNCPYTHELYHTRQYIYMGDWLIPFWLLGCLWGVISMAIAIAAADETKRKAMSISSRQAFGADGEIGNPIEIAAYKLSRRQRARRP